mmetsp:Transcript_29384/g.38664  ORF Transcript_29384/g.38664 Transcript_29384/m.38664 type:complete len:188 (+) Transcript_29384:101-664(+)
MHSYLKILILVKDNLSQIQHINSELKSITNRISILKSKLQALQNYQEQITQSVLEKKIMVTIVARILFHGNVHFDVEKIESFKEFKLKEDISNHLASLLKDLCISPSKKDLECVQSEIHRLGMVLLDQESLRKEMEGQRMNISLYLQHLKSLFLREKAGSKFIIQVKHNRYLRPAVKEQILSKKPLI